MNEIAEEASQLELAWTVRDSKRCVEIAGGLSRAAEVNFLALDRVVARPKALPRVENNQCATLFGLGRLAINEVTEPGVHGCCRAVGEARSHGLRGCGCQVKRQHPVPFVRAPGTGCPPTQPTTCRPDRLSSG